MTKTRRNAPCPCGSGRKQKHCCGKIVDAGELTRARNLRCEMELGRKAIAWVTRKHGGAVIEEAWDEFAMDILHPSLLDPDEEVPFSALFFPWWLYGGSEQMEGRRSPVIQYLDSRGTRTDALERRLVESIVAAPFSFHRIAVVDAGRSMTLEDIFIGKRQVVLERSGSVESARSTYIFARVALVDGVAGMYGSGPFLVEPALFTKLKFLRDSLTKEVGRALNEGDLHEFDAELRATYLDIVARILDPAPPELVNTDGDPMVPTRLVYDLECDCEHAFEKLRTLAKHLKRSELLEDAEHDDDGRLTKISFGWVDTRRPGRPGMGPVILGDIFLKDGRLEVEVNSEERADRIRARISRRLGTKAKFRHAVIESIEKMMEEQAARRGSGESVEPEPDQSTPEMQAFIEKAMAEHWKAWFDQSIPALEGLTPRQAAKTEEGRELLEALLADYDLKGRRGPGRPTGPDIPALRRELGLE